MAADPSTLAPVLRLLAVIEARTVTAPARLFLDFCGEASLLARSPEHLPEVRTSLATFQRAQSTALSEGRAPANAFVGAARGAGIDVAVIPERGPCDPRAVAGLRRVVTERMPDLLETHHVKSHFLMRLAGLARERPWIAFHHGYTTTDAKMRLYNQLDRWSLCGADRVITVCETFARQLARGGVSPDRIRVVHGALGPEWGAGEGAGTGDGLRARLRITAGERLVLTVGRLSREKGHLDLVAAFRHMGCAHPTLEAKLVIVGEGPERPRIVRAATRWGLGERVLLVGQVAGTREYYDAADVFVLPSHSEGSPNVLLEAIAAGVPVVATSTGGVPELVTDRQSALLVPPRRPRALGDAISRVLADAPLAGRLAAQAAVSAAGLRSAAVRARELLAIYRELTECAR